MSDISRRAGNSDPENKLESDRYEDFYRALEVLYVRENHSGRISFAKDWPHAARYIFGEELIAFDTHGVTDRERREVLENEAEVRWFSLLEFSSTLSKKSVQAGALQIDYVEENIKKLGRDLSLYLYARKIVDRFIPALPGSESEFVAIENDSVEKSQEETVLKTPPSVKSAPPVVESSRIVHAAARPSLDSRGLDEVKPIDMGAPDAPPPSDPELSLVTPPPVLPPSSEDPSQVEEKAPMVFMSSKSRSEGQTSEHSQSSSEKKPEEEQEDFPETKSED